MKTRNPESKPFHLMLSRQELTDIFVAVATWQSELIYAGKVRPDRIARLGKTLDSLERSARHAVRAYGESAATAPDDWPELPDVLRLRIAPPVRETGKGIVPSSPPRRISQPKRGPVAVIAAVVAFAVVACCIVGVAT